MKIIFLIFVGSILSCSNPSIQTLADSAGASLVEETGNLKPIFAPPQPILPPDLHRPKYEGEIIIDITVNPDGLPIQVEMISGPKELTKIYEEYAFKWRFKPFNSPDDPLSAHYTLKFYIQFRQTNLGVWSQSLVH